MERIKFKNYLYILPIFVCIVFLGLFADLEHKMATHDFDKLVGEKQVWFQKIVEAAPLFQMEDEFFLRLVEGKASFDDVDAHAFIPYKEVISEMLNNEFTFATLGADSSTIVSQYPGLKGIPFSKDTIVTRHRKATGEVKRYFLFILGKDNYWLFGATDGGMMRAQNQGLIILVSLLIGVTTVMNLFLVYFLVKQRGIMSLTKEEKKE